jgi:hypothetical protein
VKREPQIFTRIDDQDVPVSNAVLDALEQEEMTESMVRTYVRGLLAEKEIRGQKKDKRTLYHAGQRPAAPKPKMRWFDREQADEEWMRHWLASPVRSGVFLSPNPVDIAQFHGVSGNVYAYKVPEWVIEKSGGIHRFDKGSEVLIPEDVWEEAGNEIEFLGKSMSQQALWDKIDNSLFTSRGRQGNSQKPGWISTEEWQEMQAKKAKGDYLSGLRATKHLENAIKMMTPEERAEALEAFEQDKPHPGSSWPDWAKSQMDDWDRPRTEKDLEVMAVLKKYLNESVIRSYVRVLLTEAAMGPADLPEDVIVTIRREGEYARVFYAVVSDPEKEAGSRSHANGAINMIQAVAEGVGDCGGAWMIGNSAAASGWGPLLYDVAMEYATRHGGGLISDRGSVSAEARSVWDYYMHNRGDVTGIQMDDLENTLTPEEEDNCEQNVATYSTGYPSANTTDWTKSPLSKRWTKPPTTMDALKAAGKLVEL